MKTCCWHISAIALCLGAIGCSREDASKNAALTQSGGARESRVSPSQTLASSQVARVAGPNFPVATITHAEPKATAPVAPTAVLTGVIERKDSRRNLAVLALGDRAANLVRLGDRVSEEWTVASVESTKVVLVARSGHRHPVFLGANAPRGEVVAAVALPPIPPTPDKFMIDRAEAEFNMPEND